jgi:signal transduction histidine kinase
VKLASKLTVALSLGILVVHLGAAGYRVYRENELFRADIGRDARILGRALAYAAEHAWETGGEGEVIKLTEYTTGRHEHTQVRWVWLDDRSEVARPANAGAAASSVARGEPVTVTRTTPEDEEEVLTYVPVELEKGVVGALELADPLDRAQDYILNSVMAAAATVFTLVSLCAVIAWVVGARMIAIPIQSLITRARGVAEGNLSNRVEVAGSDELRALAIEMNGMCDRLEDASERASAEAAAREMTTQQLRHADRLATVGSLASNMAHELGTPINVVEGHAQLIRERGVDAKTAGHVRLIEEQCARMTSIIRQWLDFGRRGRKGDDSCVVEPVIKSSLQMIQPMAKASGVEMSFVETRETHSAAISEGELQQVILNLAVNAVQAMPDGGVLSIGVSSAPQGRLSTTDRASFVLVRISDTGIGLAPDVAERIFEPFFTTKDPGRGTGLGLSIANGIVQECGGKIEVTSQSSPGTTFHVCLPSRIQR